MSSWNVNRVVVLLGGLAALASLVVLLGPVGSPPQYSAPIALGVVAALVLAFYAPAWMYLVAAVLLALFPVLVLFAFGASAAITHPGSGLEAAALIPLALSGALGLWGGIVGFVQARRGNAPDAKLFWRTPQGFVAGAIVALFAGLLVSATWADASLGEIMRHPATNAVPDQTIHVTTDGRMFAPRNVTIPVGKLVALHVTNGDPVVHTFAYELDGVRHESVIPARSAVDVLFKFDAPRTIHFWCAPHSGGYADRDPASMWGDLVVQ